MEEIIIHYIDDDDDDRLLFLEAISHINSPVLLNLYEKHEDLFEALKKANHEKEIVVLDINMPRKDGITILKEIKENDNLQKLPVVMYSTGKTPKIIKECLEGGANLYIIKPTSFTELTKIVKEIIKLDWANLKTNSKNFIFNNSPIFKNFL